jgi:hypothetical protein
LDGVPHAVPVDPDAHEWGEWAVFTPATCVSTGEERRVCCHNSAHAESRDIPVDPGAHVWGEWITDTDATCVAEGAKHRVCLHHEARQDGVIEIDPSAHVWGEWHVTADCTCTAAGEETRICSLDNNHTDTRPLPPRHDWEEKTPTAATCESDAVKRFECKDCAQTKDEPQAGTALGHDYGGGWQSDSDGHWHECALCEAESAKAAHNWGAWAVTTPATAANNGEETRTCADCGGTQTRQLAKLPVYNVTSGANGSWKKGSATGYQITSEGAFADFDCVKVDGVVIDAVHYTVTAGSTIVTFKAAYMTVLSAGKHDFEILFKDGGKSQTSFTVQAQESPKKKFPGWAIGVIIGGGILLVGGVVVWLAAGRKKNKKA